MLGPVRADAHCGDERVRVDPHHLQGGHQGHRRLPGGQGRGSLRGLHDQRLRIIYFLHFFTFKGSVQSNR